MSSFLGTTGALWGPVHAGNAHQDMSWCRYANRMDFSMNPWTDGGAGPKRNRRYARKGIWPTAKMMAGDPSAQGYALLGNDCQNYGRWGEYIIDGRGNGSTKFLIGQVLDSTGAGISGATVTCFLTGNNLFVSTGGCDSSGNYILPTPYSGNTHFIVATLSGSPNRAGSTINNVVPTNADGT